MTNFEKWLLRRMLARMIKRSEDPAVALATLTTQARKTYGAILSALYSKEQRGRCDHSNL
jgi:hypothetical protein